MTDPSPRGAEELAIARITEAVERREAGASRDATHRKRSGDPRSTGELYRTALEHATVPGLSAASLRALLDRLKQVEEALEAIRDESVFNQMRHDVNSRPGAS